MIGSLGVEFADYFAHPDWPERWISAEQINVWPLWLVKPCTLAYQ